MHRFVLGFTMVFSAVMAHADAVPPDGGLINYASNLNQGDAYVNITNGGQIGAFLGLGGGDGDICANVYVFDPAQEMLACCSCLITPDGLNSFSVKNDLVAKSLIPVNPTTVVIKITATAANLPQGNDPPTTCVNSASTKIGVGNFLVGGLRAWGTSLHQGPLGGYSLTEGPFLPVTMGPAEIASLPIMCGFVLAEGSGRFGICNACNNNGLSGAKK